MEDEVVNRVTAAVQRGQAGDRTTAREDLETIWTEVEQGGGETLSIAAWSHTSWPISRTTSGTS